MEAVMKVEQISGALHKLSFSMVEESDGLTVNVVALIGPDGILLVDAGWPQSAERLNAKLRELSDGNVKLMIITHPHLDHYGGMGIFKEQAALIAHKNAREELLGRYFALGDLPGREMPIIEIDDELSLFFNGEEIRIIPAPGHTHSDIIVWFEDSGVVFLGDLVLSDMFPPLDQSRGGNAEQYVECLSKLIDQLPPDVRLITGHGRDYSLDDLREHHRMARATVDLIKKGLAEGKDVQTMVEENILKDWAKWDTPQVSSETLITQACQSLSGEVKPSISEPLTSTILEQGQEAAVEQYRDLKENQPESYNFGEGELNTLGYQLLRRDMLEAAVEVFKLNVKAFPNSANPCDSLGEGYAAMGKQELAIESYEKALANDPEFPSAIAALKNLRAEREN
jgi:glyoxylase-like metal-dependent hydrolase (beta-lactamase superfamily II)